MRFSPLNGEQKYIFYLPERQFFSSWNMGGWDINDIYIYTEQSMHDCPSDDHRFQSVHCRNINNIKEALNIGVELISLLRGFYTIVNKDDVNFIKVLSVFDQNRQTLYFEESEYYFGLYQDIGDSLKDKLRTHEYKQYIYNSRVNLVNSSMYLAQKRKNYGLYLILKYFSMPLDWVVLYKIMETLETISEHHDKGWKPSYSKAEKKKFTNPANNFNLLQIDSRHGFKFDALDNNPGQKMSFDEAKMMFKRCAHSYLKYKFEEMKYLAWLEKRNVTHFIRGKSEIDLDTSKIRVYEVLQS
ncbi:hypothetical protein AWW72_16420 [Acinetobacter sp. NRRL B-65365]|uniref:hypothetical protein n=1 Tax=Acinetobacter sp. NRRL B-65365 TaxID=1785092 RepID=UPI0007A003EB|nr:hypothetical protein [Acinetobacter sp. NRRL B-65365]KYQ82968.1 hypothetical protein AWW72_16420 [Acinetobacter sp. NRRL B-65365]